jgi:hypothetical protein
VVSLVRTSKPNAYDQREAALRNSTFPSGYISKEECVKKPRVIGASSFYRPLVPFWTAPDSVLVPVLWGPAAVPAPELLASPAAEGVVPVPVPVVPSPVVLLAPPVVPVLIAPPELVPLAAGAPEEELPLAAPPELWANANELLNANAVARAIVVIFIRISLVCVQGKSRRIAEVPKLHSAR